MLESLSYICELCKTENKSFYEVVLDAEMTSTMCDKATAWKKMEYMWDAMKGAVKNYDETLMSRSGLSGGDGGKFEKYTAQGSTICGDFMGKVIATALKTAESNACMKRIVAAPTAGSCGVLPAVLIPLYIEETFSEEKIIEGLFVSAGIGQVIANRASISGAEGGCQAEIGAASAMASGTLVYLYGGNAEQICAAVGFTLQNLLGLVCDPVAGLVEVPCVKRNVIGAVNACSCADMALAGILPKIPCDEVIDAMKKVGDAMPESLRETGFGGIAASPTGKKFRESL